MLIWFILSLIILYLLIAYPYWVIQFSILVSSCWLSYSIPGVPIQFSNWLPCKIKFKKIYSQVHWSWYWRSLSTEQSWIFKSRSHWRCRESPEVLNDRCRWFSSDSEVVLFKLNLLLWQLILFIIQLWLLLKFCLTRLFLILNSWCVHPSVESAIIKCCKFYIATLLWPI